MRLKHRSFIVSIFALLFGGLGVGDLVPESESALAQTGDPVFVGAGDITNCNRPEDEATAQLLDNIAGTVFTLGDNAYPDGTQAQFNDCYGPTWGRHKNRTKPSAGNHDYHIAGAAGYYTYFGAAASPLDNNCTSNCKGYYSYNLGAWHIIVLNNEITQSAGSAQEQWLRADLAANQSICTLAYWHKPRFSSGMHGNIAGSQALWQALYDAGADVVLNGHDHLYERFAPQNPSGQADAARGIREFVVGTGGAALYPFTTIQPNSQVRNNTTHGVLKLTLHSTSYDWQFIPIAGQNFTDSGSGNCVTTGSIPTATRTPTSGPAPTATRTSTPGPTATWTSTPGSSDLIFADSFESGNFSAWSSNTTDGGDLSASGAAALIGSNGMRAVIDDNNSIYVTDDRPTAEPRYRARFYFDPNSIGMVSGDAHFIFKGIMGTSTEVLQVEFRRSSGTYQLRARLLNDASNWISTNWFTISDASHFIELDWRAATAAGANNGGLTLWIDGTQQANLTGVDNDTRRIDRARLGAVIGIDTGTRGTYYFDAFESRRLTYIGPAGSVPTPGVTPTSVSSATNTPLSTATRTSTPGPTATRTSTPGSSDLIFADSFESGNFSAWSSNTTDGGDLSASGAAALIGSNGMRAVIDDNNSIYVTDDRPTTEPRYRARFYFDPNSIPMVSGDAHFIFKGIMGTSTEVLQVEFRRSSGTYQLRARLLNDASNWISTNWFTISDASHFIELDWRAATAAGANNGGLTLWIDGTQQANLTGVDNDTRRIDRARLGAVIGIDTGTRGTYYFDAFESRRLTYIGPAGSVPTPGVTPTSVSPATNTPLSTATRTPTRTNTPTPTPMHVGDLDGTSIHQGNQWTATVTITVHDVNHNPVSNATVSGTWSNGASGTASCTTGSNGQCSVNRSSISNGTSSVTFTVNNVTRVTFTYVSANNHDPDGSSNGTRIVVRRS